MKLLQNILVPTDFGDSSGKALETAISLAKVFGSRITLLHAIQEARVPAELESFIMETVNEKLDQWQKKIEEQEVLFSDPMIRKGVPFEKIIQAAREISANVIVVGAGNYNGDDAYRLGTTVEKLMRKNQVPLWVVRSDSPSRWTKILCPVDFSEASKRALSNAITLARYFDAHLTILNVFTPINLSSARLQVDEMRENQNLKQQQEQDFASFLEDFDLGSLKSERVMKVGEPEEEILNAIGELEIDLLLMGTTGKTALSRILMGSVTEKVTRALPCDFVTTKARDLTENILEDSLKEIETVIQTGRNALNRGDADTAVEIFAAGTRQFPDNIPILTGLVESYKAAGNKERADYYRNYTREIIERMWGKEYLDRINLD